MNFASKEYKKKTMNFYQQNQSKKLRTMSEKSPKKYWKFLNNLKPKQKVTEHPSLEDFFDHFHKINQSTIDNNRYQVDFENVNVQLNSEITEREISQCIFKLKNCKTPSPSNNVLNEYIKATQTILMPLYCKLFNCILDTGYKPKSWLEGAIIPIYKNKGDPKDPPPRPNYRPITILSCLGKLFTSLLHDRLTLYLNENNILNKKQAGFRKDYSCTGHTFTLHSLFEIIKKQKRNYL